MNFIERWKDKGNELSDTQSFWNEFLHDVLGVENPTQLIDYQKRVEVSNIKFIDAYIPSTRVIIEQKSLDVDLDVPARQSDGSLLTPFEQAKRYRDWLPASEQGRYILVSNFRQIRIHDMETPKAKPQIVELEDIRPEIFSFMVKPERIPTHEELISQKAGKLARKLYEYLLKKYVKPNDKGSRDNLNIFCVRLVFLLYAEDSKLFEKSQFHDYLKAHSDSSRIALEALFRVLNIKERDPYLDADLKAFPCVNGGLFEDVVPLPPLDDEALRIILEDMSEGFDWSQISPPIFGAIFESILNEETRTTEGSHYTALENIHKVIDPLFLDELTTDAEALLSAKDTPRKKFTDFQKKLASLTFLDPACGSGNFLTETYLSLRKLENRIIRALSAKSYKPAKNEKLIRVSISQFYGIEVNSFAVAVARTALWIAEAQMWEATKKEDERQAYLDFYGDYLPLKSRANIHHENAIRVDWAKIIPPSKLNYIMGNPPYRGARIMTGEQKDDVALLFKGKYKLGDLDYVCCWYVKAWKFIKGTKIRAAFVSTNSLNQGDTVAFFWKPLTDDGLHIDFAHRSFVWDNDTNEKAAHVHCAVMGFSDTKQPAVIYDGDRIIRAEHINAYIIDGPDMYIFSRAFPLSDVPGMRIGNKPIDGGFYLFTIEQYEEFIKKEPGAKEYFHIWYGGYEFLHNEPRMCLYLGNCSPHQIKMMPECYKRVEAVRQYRLASKSIPTKKLADKPTRFHVETFPKGSYIVVPKTSSEKRKYIPMGFLDESVMCADSLRVIPNATLYHFGVLESQAHMAWTRIVAGRLEMRYSYSNTLVYNCFVWPQTAIDCRLSSEKHVARITETARGILEARAKYPDSSLAELYDETLMPVELRRAHERNDEAVREAYGWPEGLSEYEMVRRLFGLYERATAGERR